MGIFEKRTKRRPPRSDEGNLELEGLEEIREQVPNVDDTMARLETALNSSMEEGGCGCWG